jgi:heat shock protein HtpX
MTVPLITRVAVAIIATVGFYLLAAAVAAGLCWIPYALDYPRLALPLFPLAGAIMWSIFPRRERFEAPGVRIELVQQPRLFAELFCIAQSLNQEMPEEVYLVPEPIAWVSQRGGVMGFGGRRIMALGVPLMALLTVSQFRAVLAHEFAHYYSGDTNLIPWIYRTRAAMWRNLIELGRRESALFVLFKWYAKFFLRITLAISKIQEHAADQFGAKLGGAKALRDALMQVYRCDVAWNNYLEMEILPVVSAGYCPPLSRGFAQFLQAPMIKTSVNKYLKRELEEGKATPLDSHPALSERIAMLLNMPIETSEDTRVAADLVDGFDALDLIGSYGAGSSLHLEPIEWEEVLNRVWLPRWQSQADWQSEGLRGTTVATLVEDLSSGALAVRLKNFQQALSTAEQRAQAAVNVTGCAIALALLRDGWTLQTSPGQVYCTKNGECLAPFELVLKIAQGELTEEGWKSFCDRVGIKLTLPIMPENI